VTPTLKYNIKLYACLLAGGVLLVFSNLNQAIPLAAWLFPVFIMRYMRRQRSVPGMIAAALVVVGATFMLYWRVMATLNPLLMTVLIGSSGILAFAVFFADRLIARRLTGLLSTMVFPCLWTAVEYLKSFIPGAATFGSLAYSQYGDLPLMQLVSLTGIWGLTFLISWFAPVVNFIWEKKVEWLKIRSVAGAFAAVFAAVMVFGGARLALFPPAGEYVRTAGITATGTNAGFVSVYRDRVFPPLEQYRQRLTALSGRTGNLQVPSAMTMISRVISYRPEETERISC